MTFTRESFESTFAAAGAAICVVDSSDIVTAANANWLELAGDGEANVVGRRMGEIFLDAPMLPLVAQARAGQLVQPIPHHEIRGGRDVWFETHITAIPLGGVGAVLVSVHVVPARPMSDTSGSHGVENRLQGLLDGMLAGCQLIGFDWRYLYLNDAALKQKRRTMDELLGQFARDVPASNEPTTYFAGLQHSMHSRQASRFESESRYDDGSSAWFDVSVLPHPEGIFVQTFDITDRKRSDDSLARVRDELEAVVQASPVAIAALDRAGKVILWNPAAEGVFGWTASEVVGHPLPMIPDDKKDEFAMMRQRARDGVRVDGEVTFRLHRDGTRIPVKVSTAPLRGADGEPKGIVAVILDLREQKALLEALVDSERRFGAVFEASPAPKALVRASDRHIIEANPAFLELFGLTREDVIAQPTSVLPLRLVEDEREAFWGELARFDRVVDYGIKFVNAAGEDGEANLSAQMLTSGGERYALVVLIDMTARNRATRALAESDERFRQLAESIEEVFWLTDPQKGSIVYLSPAYARIWGRSVESVYQSPTDWIDAIHPDDRARVVDAAMTKQALGTYDEEYRIVRPDGSIRWVRDRGFPVRDASGAVIRVAGTAQDITSRRTLETQLRQTQKMESVGLLAGGVAHDFNNLLTVIGANTDALGEILTPDSLTSTILSEIRQATERAAGLTRQLLAFSRRDATEPRVVELEAVVLDAEKMLRRILGEDIILTIRIAVERLRVRIDAGSWLQVLMNLAVNARDAMPRGGALSIATSRVTLSDAQKEANPQLTSGPYACLTVTDDGTGMPASVVTRVFEPFFTTKPLGRGTGLGLSVVHGIVTQSGGYIEVSSEPGKGTTFRAFVPLVEAELSRELTASAGVDLRGTETILIVEDDDAIRRTAKRALERVGYHVLHAGDGGHALDIAREHAGPIHLLLTDVVMPRMSGRELAESLSAICPGLRVLFTSGYTDEAVSRHGIEQRDVAFLPKPYDLPILRLRVREVLDRE